MGVEESAEFLSPIASEIEVDEGERDDERDGEGDADDEEDDGLVSAMKGERATMVEMVMMRWRSRSSIAR